MSFFSKPVAFPSLLSEFADVYASCPASGLRVHEGMQEWRLQDNAATYKDSRCMRVSVVISGTPTNYIGNAAREALEDVQAALQYKDDSLSAVATALATQLYNEFSTASYFIPLTAFYQGFIQPGQIIAFNWSLGGVTVSLANYIMLAVHAKLVADIQEVLLGNNITLQPEFDNLALTDEQ